MRRIVRLSIGVSLITLSLSFATTNSAQKESKSPAIPGAVSVSAPASIFFVFDVPYYTQRTKMEQVPKHIPLGDVRWLAVLLSQLSDRQIEDAFQAAGYSPTEVQGCQRRSQKDTRIRKALTNDDLPHLRA